MKIADVLLADFDAEIAGARRVLERIPENDPQWKPHEKSMPIGRLAVHVARLPEFCTRILTSTDFEIDKAKMPDFIFQSTAQLLSELERTSTEARSQLASSSDEDLTGEWKLIFKGRTVIQGSRLAMYRSMFFNHLVHHRAQLGVYLRLLNIPVPGLYGPSADEPFA